MDDHYTVLKAPPIGDGISSLDSQVATTPATPVGSPATLEPSSIPPLPSIVSSFNVSSAKLGSGFLGPSPAQPLVVPLGPVGG